MWQIIYLFSHSLHVHFDLNYYLGTLSMYNVILSACFGTLYMYDLILSACVDTLPKPMHELILSAP
jgi:hypothetical protein